MLAFTLRRIIQAVPVLLGVSLLVFLILQLIPGNPAEIMSSGTRLEPEQVEALARELGLDQSLPHQYAGYLADVIQGDLGRSFRTGRPVSEEIMARLPSTIGLTLAGMFVALVTGLLLGVIAGLRPGGATDAISSGISVLGAAIPYFFLALVLVIVFAVNLQWLPALGVGSPQALILPAVSLGWGFAAVIARLVRSEIISVNRQPFIQVARAKGLPGRTLFLRHTTKNVALPLVTILGLQIGNMLAGAVVIETIFARPGIGQYLVEAIQNKDIPVVQGVVLLIAVVYVVANIVVDLAHAALDPRIRAGYETT